MVDMRDDGEIADFGQICHGMGYELESWCGQARQCVVRRLFQVRVLWFGGFPHFSARERTSGLVADQPQVTHRKLAMLGALRILPLALEKPTGVVGPPTVLWTTADSLEHDQRCLAIFRAAITGTTAAWDRNSLLDHAAQKARENLRKLEKTKSAVLRTTSNAASIFKFAALVNSPDILSRDRSAKFAASSLEGGWTLLRDVSTATEREEWQVDPELAWDVAHNVELLTPSHLRLFNASSQPAQSIHTWETFCTETGPQPSPWQFWRDWYQGMLGGTPMDWDLQLQIALIEDAIWNAGPEAVAAEIEAIKAQFLSEKAPLAEVIKLNLETGKFHAVPIPVQNAPLLTALLTQISDALEDAVAGNNGLSEQSSEFRKLTRTFQRYGNDPQQAELTLTTVAKRLRRQIHESKELPDSEDNLALLEAVEDGVRGIRAHHPEVAANREQLAHQAFKVMNPADKETLSQALPVLTALSETALAEDFSADIPELINDTLLPLPDGAPRLPGADATTRVFSRVSKMALAWDKVEALSETGANIFDSKIAKSLRLFGFATASLGTVGAMLYGLVQIGLRILGVL